MPSYTSSIMYIPSDRQALIERVRRAIDGQYSAVICYEQLAKMAPNKEEMSRILEIRMDEIRHFEVFSGIYAALTGREPAPHRTEPCPDRYVDGLQAALIDEQETVDFYLDIADSTRDPYIQKQFRRAAADEQNHAVWFLYLFIRQAGKGGASSG